MHQDPTIDNHVSPLVVDSSLSITLWIHNPDFSIWLPHNVLPTQGARAAGDPEGGEGSASARLRRLLCGVLTRSSLIISIV
jgi:hypothetical protein